MDKTLRFTYFVLFLLNKHDSTTATVSNNTWPQETCCDQVEVEFSSSGSTEDPTQDLENVKFYLGKYRKINPQGPARKNEYAWFMTKKELFMKTDGRAFLFHNDGKFSTNGWHIGKDNRHRKLNTWSTAHCPDKTEGWKYYKTGKDPTVKWSPATINIHCISQDISKNTTESPNPQSKGRGLWTGIENCNETENEDHAFHMSCDPFMASENNLKPGDCAPEGIGPRMSALHLNVHPDCTGNDDEISCVCRNWKGLIIDSQFYTIHSGPTTFKVSNCDFVKIGSFFSSFKNTINQISLVKIQHLTLLSESLDLYQKGTVGIQEVDSLMIQKGAFGSHITTLALVNTNIEGIQSGAFHNVGDMMDMFLLSNITFPRRIAESYLLPRKKLRIKRFEILNSDLGQISYNFVNDADMDFMKLSGNRMEIVSNDVFKIETKDLIIEKNEFDILRTKAMTFWVDNRIKIEDNIVDHGQKFSFANIKPMQTLKHFSFVNNTFKDFDDGILIFNPSVLTLNSAILNLENITLEFECSCELLEQVLVTKDVQILAKMHNEKVTRDDLIFQQFKMKLKESLLCYREGKLTRLKDALHCELTQEESVLVIIGTAIGASSIILVTLFVIVFLIKKRRQRQKAKESAKKFIVPRNLPRESSFNLKLEQAEEWRADSLPDLLQATGGASGQPTPSQSTQDLTKMSQLEDGARRGHRNGREQNLNRTSYAEVLDDGVGIYELGDLRSNTLSKRTSDPLADQQNVMLRTEDPEIEREGYSSKGSMASMGSMVIHFNRASTDELDEHELDEHNFYLGLEEH